MGDCFQGREGAEQISNFLLVKTSSLQLRNHAPAKTRNGCENATQCEEASASDITGNAQTKRCKHGGATVGSRNKKKKKKVTKLRGSRKSMESEFQDSSQCHHSLVVSWLGPPQ